MFFLYFKFYISLVDIRLNEPLWKVLLTPSDVAIEILTLCTQLEPLCKRTYTVSNFSNSNITDKLVRTPRMSVFYTFKLKWTYRNAYGDFPIWEEITVISSRSNEPSSVMSRQKFLLTHAQWKKVQPDDLHVVMSTCVRECGIW